MARDETDERILGAALAEFERNGIRRARVGVIATEAGVGRATVYRRYADKDALVAAVLQRKLEAFLAALGAAMEAESDLATRLVEGFVTTLRYAREDALLARVRRSEPEAVLPALTTDAAPFLQLCVSYLAEQLRSAQSELAPGYDVEVVAEVAVRIAHSIVATPGLRIAPDDEGAREFARTYFIAPLLER